MKKIILALVILIIIVTSGIISVNLYKKSSIEISRMLDNVSELVDSNNWNEAKQQIDDVEKEWSKTERIWTLLIDHLELDNIEMSLKKSKKYIEAKDTALSLGELQNLKFMVEHIYSKEAFNLENIF